ncbi:MAG TPA: YdjY domain-containing protein [Chthonomonadales bacterium]|nr:YdjY domain-containing protein [Chthonomonadales bacterium]
MMHLRQVGNFIGAAAIPALLLVWAHGATPAQKPASGAPHTASRPQQVAPVEKITDSVYLVGKAMVDTKARTVTCNGAINMREGPVEYLAVTPLGKTYESVLRIDVRPLHLQVALLLLGLEPRNVLARQGDPATPQGAPVELRVEWRDAHGSSHNVPAEGLVAQMPGFKRMPPHAWVFTGSRVLKAGFEADLCGSLVAVWHDPAAMLDNPLPGGGTNSYVANTANLPPLGTRIRLVFHALAAAGRPG